MAFGKRFRLYSLVTMVILIAFGILTGLDEPRIGANLPTPYVGIWQRINIGLFMLWVLVFAIVLLRVRQSYGVRTMKPLAASCSSAGRHYNGCVRVEALDCAKVEMLSIRRHRARLPVFPTIGSS